MKLINGQMYPRLPNTSSGIKLWQGQIYESVFQIQPSIEALHKTSSDSLSISISDSYNQTNIISIDVLTISISEQSISIDKTLILNDNINIIFDDEMKFVQVSILSADFPIITITENNFVSSIDYNIFSWDDLDIFLKETFIIDEKSIYDYLNLLELRELPLEFKLKELSLGFVRETIPLDYRLKEKELKYKLTELPLEFKLKEVMKKA